MTWLTQFLSSMAKPLKWWVTIAPWERGLRVRLGKTAVVLMPGIRLRIPFLDRIYVQSVRVRTISEIGLTVSSRDGHVLTYGIALHFAIADIGKLYGAAANPEQRISALASASVAAFASATDRAQLDPEGIALAARSGLVSTAYILGLEQCDASVTSFAFSRAIRLLTNNYQTVGGLYNFETTEGNGLK